TRIYLCRGSGFAPLVRPGNDTRPRADRLAVRSVLKAEDRVNRRPLIMLDERAVARWIGSQLAAARKAKKKIRIEDIVQDAAEKFGKSDVTIRRAWQRFGPLERQRNPK